MNEAFLSSIILFKIARINRIYSLTFVSWSAALRAWSWPFDAICIYTGYSMIRIRNCWSNFILNFLINVFLKLYYILKKIIMVYLWQNWSNGFLTLQIFVWSSILFCASNASKWENRWHLRCIPLLFLLVLKFKILLILFIIIFIVIDISVIIFSTSWHSIAIDFSTF